MAREFSCGNGLSDPCTWAPGDRLFSVSNGTACDMEWVYITSGTTHRNGPQYIVMRLKDHEIVYPRLGDFEEMNWAWHTHKESA